MIKEIAVVDDLGKHEKKGIECRFWQQGEIGVKAYKSRQAAYAAAKLQQIAFEKLLGPMVIEFGLIRDRFGKCQWGYTTELATPIFDNIGGNLFHLVCESPEYKILVEELHKIGVSEHEMHRGNVGFMNTAIYTDDNRSPKTSVLVCIDFGSDSRKIMFRDIRTLKTARKSSRYHRV